MAWIGYFHSEMKVAQISPKSTFVPQLWAARFFIIVATMTSSFFLPVSNNLPVTFKTELHEKIRIQVTHRTQAVFQEPHSSTPFNYSRPTNFLAVVDFQNHCQLKLNNEVLTDRPARVGYHPIHRINHDDEAPFNNHS